MPARFQIQTLVSLTAAFTLALVGACGEPSASSDERVLAEAEVADQPILSALKKSPEAQVDACVDRFRCNRNDLQCLDKAYEYCTCIYEDGGDAFSCAGIIIP